MLLLYCQRSALLAPTSNFFCSVDTLSCIIFTTLVLQCYGTKFGMGRHTYFLLPEEIVLAAKWRIIAAASAVVSLAVPKFAIVILLKRIVAQTRRRSIVILYFLTALNSVLSFIVVLVLFLECSPPSASWDPSIPHSCWSRHVVPSFTIFVGGMSHCIPKPAKAPKIRNRAGYSAAVDLLLALYPASIVSKLKIPRNKKIAISSVMGLGVL